MRVYTLTPSDISCAGQRPRLLDWARQNVTAIQDALQEHGIIWFRGFDAPEPDLCQRLISLIGGTLLDDVFWLTPRSRVSGKTFTATEYPAREEIPPHSEMSYLTRYPRLLCFHALHCADTGGQTTVADLDAVSADLGGLTNEFLERGVRYVRVFRDGIDIPLSKAFGTEDLTEITRIARAQGMRIERGTDGAIRVTHEAQGALADARGGQPIWFNQLHLSHPAHLPPATRASLVALLGADGLPRHAFFADGGLIADGVVHTVDAAFTRHAGLIEWQPSDVVLIDNLRYAHGRRPFTGSRALHVAMGLPQSGGTREPIFQ